MMANSQNGWSVITDGSKLDRGDIYPGIKVPNGVRPGDVAVILRYVAARFHREVEPLKPGTCWGWLVKGIEGSTSTSNHASGTAIDLNAPQHPLGKRGTFTAGQAKACRRIVAACDGVVRWGGDYTGRADEMHWEIIGSAAQAARLATKIREGEDVDVKDIENAEHKHGDDQEVPNWIAWHNVAEVLRRGGWKDWWIVRQVEQIVSQGSSNGSNLSLIRSDLAKVAADVAEIKAQVAALQHGEIGGTDADR